MPVLLPDDNAVEAWLGGSSSSSGSGSSHDNTVAGVGSPMQQQQHQVQQQPALKPTEHIGGWAQDVAGVSPHKDKAAPRPLLNQVR
jgi:hypothetical protein